MTQVFSTMLTLSIKAGWLVLAVLVVRLLLKRAPKTLTCLLWLLVAVRLVCPFEVTSPFSAFQFLMVTGSNAASGETDVRGTTDGSYTRESTKYQKGSETTTTSDAATAAEQTTSVSSSTATDAANGTWTASDVDWRLIEAGVWAGGTVLLLVVMLVYIVRFRKKLQIAVPLEKGVYICEEITEPFVFGCLRPAIYLPSGLDKQTRKSVLAHEKAHIRRKDALWKTAGYILLCVYWWNPLLWVAYALFCRDLEMACDEQVIRDMQSEERKSYAQALLDVSSKRRSVFVYPLGFGEVGVKGRIKAVLSYKKMPVWAGVIAVILCLAVAIAFLTAPKTDDDFLQLYPQGTDSTKVLIGGETDPLYTLQVPGNYVWSGTFKRLGETRDINEENQAQVSEPLSDGTKIPSYIWNTFTLNNNTDMDFSLEGMFTDLTKEETEDIFPGYVSVGTKKLPAIAQMVYVDSDTVETADKLPMADGQTVTDGQEVTDGRVLQLNLLVDLPKGATKENTIQLLLEYRSPSLTTDAKKWGQYLYHMLSACSDTDKEAVLNANDQLAAAVPKTASLDIKQNYRVSRYLNEETRNRFDAATANYDFKKNAAAIINGKVLTKDAPESLDGQLQYSIENHRMTVMIYPDSNWIGYTSDYYKGGFYLTADEMKQLTDFCSAEIDDNLAAGITEWSESDWSETMTPVVQEN